MNNSLKGLGLLFNYVKAGSLKEVSDFLNESRCAAARSGMTLITAR